MTWFKVDDSFHSHPKVLAADPAALGLWVVAGAWCGANLTDGFVPDYALPRLLPDAARLADNLVACRLWKRARGGYRFHDWGDYNPTSDAVKAERAAARDRMRELRAKRKQKGKSPAQEQDGSPEQNPNVRVNFGGSSPTPTRPDPTRTSSDEEVTKTSSSSPPSQATQEPATPERIDVERVCAYLAEWIVKNGSKRPNITKKWRAEARLLIDKDGRPLDEIRDVIAWSQRDPFWRSNVLSLPKLREKYDQLRLAMQRPAGQPGTDLAIPGQAVASSLSAADGAPLPAGTGNSRMTDAMRLAAHYDALDGTNTITRHLAGA